MVVDKELYKFSCISKMGKEYLDKWKKLKDICAPKLDRGPILQPVAYTYHDYTHHCYNIYKLISQVILFEPRLTAQEWFILDTAVLLHDISMTEPNFDRLTHSEQSAKWLLDCMKKQDLFRQNLSMDEAEAVALIIKAHSDRKERIGEKEEVSVYTLEDSAMPELMDCGGAQSVRVKFLSAILRIADECDVTRKRIGTADFDKLDERDPEQRYSKEQWLQLKCFKSIKRKGENIELCVDDNYVKENSSDRKRIEGRIWKVVHKIRGQLDYVRRQAVKEDKCLSMFPLRSVKIVSDSLDAEYVKKVNEGRYEDKKILGLRPHILDDDLAKEIAIKINEKGLTATGHYIVTDTFCERDWIDLRDIVVDGSLSTIMIDRIMDEIEKEYGKYEDFPIIIAMEDNGLILASQIAYRLGFPFSYIIPCNYSQKRSSEQEKYIDFRPYKNVILITDAVATFQTLALTCEKYRILDKVCRIYTVLYRKPRNEVFFHEYAEELMEKLTACCDSFEMEVYYRERCPDNKSDRCKALNK